MKSHKKLAIAAFFLCIPFLGGWTSVPAKTEEAGYTGGPLLATYASETISYTSKQVVEDIATANNAPAYYPIDGITNACGAVAGAIVVGFYDKYYEDLIPGWSSAYASGRYKSQDRTYVPALINDLYTRMKTNTTVAGVTESQCKTGLQNYAASKGYNLNYVSLGSGNSFNYTTFKAAVKNNDVSVLFVQPSNLYVISTDTNKDVLETYTISATHVMVAYGYYEVKYTTSGGTRTDKYLRVATGRSDVTTAYYKVGSYIDSAYQVKIN